MKNQVAAAMPEIIGSRRERRTAKRVHAGAPTQNRMRPAESGPSFFVSLGDEVTPLDLASIRPVGPIGGERSRISGTINREPA